MSPPSTLPTPWLALAVASNGGQLPGAVYALARQLACTPRTLRRWSGGATRPCNTAILAIRALAQSLNVPSPL